MTAPQALETSGAAAAGRADGMASPGSVSGFVPTAGGQPLRRRLFQSWGGKFLIAALPTLLFVNLVFGFLTGIATYRMIDDEVEQTHAATLRSEALRIGDLLKTGRFAEATRQVERLEADHDVIAARLLDTAGGTIATVGEATEDGKVETVPIADPATGAVFGRLEVTYAVDDATRRLITIAGQALLHTIVVSLAFAFLLIGLTRRMLTEPLGRVIEAIQSSQSDGLRHRVDWAADDEVGDLVSTFNDMQTRLEDGERRRRSFNERLARLYNRTPAMLHSVDREGTLIHVSDHWLVATGYRRSDVIGRKLQDFLAPESGPAYRHEILPRFVETGTTPETPLRLVKYDGTVLDVVLAETVDMHIGGRYPLSLSVMSDVSRMKSVEREMMRLARTDAVTGLANRRGFVEAVEAEVDRLDRIGGTGAILLIDLDRFKRVNDTYGHAAGDQMLVVLARRIGAAAGAKAIAGRLGGDEFAVFLPSCTVECGLEVAERLLAEMRAPIDVGPAVVEASGSIGMAVFPDDGETGTQLMKAADLALYRAKQAGRNRFERFARSMGDALVTRQAQEQDIREGLALGRFEIFVQPIVRLDSGRIIGGEALVRLRHPERGIIGPGQFITAAEESGLIEPLGRAVLESATRLLPLLIGAARNPDFFLSVNLSGGQVNADLPGVLADLVRRNGITPGNIVLEIMETALLEDADEVNAILSEIAALGIRFALDDFGTGYSSLNYVDRFPVSMIKIDQMFTHSCGEGDEGRTRTPALVRTIVTLGRELGLPIVAEGIESDRELVRMSDLGVDLGQGYLFAPPMPAHDFLELLAASNGHPLADEDATLPVRLTG